MRNALTTLVRRLAARFQPVRSNAFPTPSPEQAAALAVYLQGIASSQRAAHDTASGFGMVPEARMFQGGAAAAEVVSDLLLAAATGDKQRFKDSLYAFVHGAAQEGLIPAA